MKELYFKMEADFLKESKVQHLLEKQGLAGLGFYLLLLLELLGYEDCRASIAELKRIARKYGISDEMASCVIYDFGLFRVCDQESDLAYLSSVYLDRVMADIKRARKACSEAGKKGARIRLAKLGKPLKEDDSRVVQATLKQEEEVVILHLDDEVRVRKENENNIPPADKNKKNWEQLIDETIRNDSWLELMTMRTKLPFSTRAKEIAEIFKEHVVIQGTESRLVSDADVRNYMANLTNPWSPAHKRIAAELAKRVEITRENNPYRYEDVDPATGARSYYGIPIPEHAPPRPNNIAQWIEEEKRWF